MNGSQNMYGQPYPMYGPQSAMNGYPQDDSMEGLNTAGLDTNMMSQGHSQTLDQIIDQNNQEIMRRRQTFNPAQRSTSGGEHNRRYSMMEFTSNNSGDLADFQFDPNPQQAAISDRVANPMPSQQPKHDPRKVRSREDLSLDTRFSQMVGFDGSSMSPYSATGLPSSTIGLDNTSSMIPQDLDMSNMNNNFESMVGNVGGMTMSPNPAQSMYSNSPGPATFPMQYQSNNHDSGSGDSRSPQHNNMMRASTGVNSSASTPQRYLGKSQQQIKRNPMMPSPLGMSAQQSIDSTMLSHPSQPRSRRASMELSQPGFNNNQAMNMDNAQLPPQPLQSRYANAYSTTGFDMLAVLMRVATRSNPEINIGPVDLSCAFVVCDIQKHDLPIVYCSDMFERLTGYSRHEILGRNCRFLQAPDGKVQSGVKRKYVDDKSVLYLKNQINRRAEAQLSLINYRKGGQPFMNLLTMIPIQWDSEEFRFFVGFQVDLVEQPNSVSAKNPDGTYEINYNRSALPAYRLPAPDPNSALENMGGQTIPRDEVSQVLATIGNGETDLSRRIWDKVLLENTDDVVHVLSLKGLFLYLSPACKAVLEYEPQELVGTALSSVCHPSDIVPVTRELKDSSSGATVNVVYRIRRKNSGYTWFEAHGCLHTEQGKGRKCIILIGRQRPVYALDRNEIVQNEGTGDAELWTKMSTTGMFLYVSSTSRSMLDRLPDDLVGMSMQSLMRPESRKEFGRVLELARLGEKSTFKHDMQNRRGQVLQAQTTVYPGDAKKGLKPTFLLGQTRLLKMTRSMLMSSKSQSGNIPRSDASMGSGTPMSHGGAGTPQRTVSFSATPQAHMISSTGTEGQAPFVGESGILTQAGSGGVPIGSQDEALASEDNIFDELKTTRSTSWQFELRQMERQNRLLAEDLQTLLSRKKKRKRRKGMGNLEKDCANCHTRVTPEWRRGPSGQRDLCNSCGLRWAKQVSRRKSRSSQSVSTNISSQNGRVSPRKSGVQSDKSSTSPVHLSQSVENNMDGGDSGNATGAGANGLIKHENSENSTPRAEGDDSAGNMPPTIEEGQEPPHQAELPT